MLIGLLVAYSKMEEMLMYENYIVQPGDTLERIAIEFQVPMAEIIHLNNLENSYYLQAGTTLKIPITQSSAFDTYIAKKGDTIFSLAKQSEINPSLLAAINGINTGDYLYAGQQILLPKPGVHVFLTRPGDTIQGLAAENQVNPKELLIYNKNIFLLPNQIIAYRVRE